MIELSSFVSFISDIYFIEILSRECFFMQMQRKAFTRGAHLSSKFSGNVYILPAHISDVHVCTRTR